MNKSVWRARLLSIGGILETGAGLGLLIGPSALSSLLLGSPLTAAGVIVARLGGGGLLALGIACWCARGTPSAPASLGAAWAFLAYNLIACITLGLASFESPGGALLLIGASALHGVLGAALLAVQLGRREAPAES